jgi:transposase-like protein
MMEKLQEKEQVVIEYLAGGTTMRRLAKKSGYSRAAISRWVIAERKEMGKRAMLEVSKASKGKDAMPTGVKELQEALRMARLHICLLEATIDISDEQFGTNIRKKAGTRPL